MDRISELLSEVLVQPAERWSAALEDACRTHAASAPELRRRFTVLRRMGVADVEPTLTADPPLPEAFGPYRLGKRLGGGGMGIVYLARHVDLGRNVALKLIRPERLFFDNARERFRREIEAVARLEHPGCVQIHQVGEERGVPYFAMEYVTGLSLEHLVQTLAGQPPSKLTGQDLARALRQHVPNQTETATGETFQGPWSRVCLRLVLAAADALAHAHARGVIHRDIKPSNLMLTPEGRVVVIDFGLAVAEGMSRMTNSGAFLGSLPYMAPEQLRQEHGAVDARTDVYALGVCLFELLTLTSPFESRDAETTRHAILLGRTPALRQHNPAVSADVAVVCGKAMDVDPRRRYQSMAEFAADLAAVLEHRAIAARPAGLVRNTARWARRRPATATAMALSSAGLLLGPLAISLAIAVQRDRARAAEQSARRSAYSANVAAASAALLVGNAPEARLRLDTCGANDRGFEWHHLDLGMDAALLTLRTPCAPVTAVALTSQLVAAGGEDGTIAVLAVPSGAPRFTLHTNGDRVRLLRFLANGGELLAIDAAEYVSVFELGTGKLVRERARSTRAERLTLAADARALLADRGGGRLAHIDVDTLAEVEEYTLDAVGELPMGFLLTDGVKIAMPLQIGGAATWDLRSGRALDCMQQPFGTTSMCAHGDLTAVACADPDGNLALHDFARRRSQLLDTGKRSVADIAFTLDRRYLVAACTTGDLLTFDATSGRLVRQLSGHRGAVTCIVPVPDLDGLATGGRDGTVRVWNPDFAPEASHLNDCGAGHCVVATPDGAVLHGNLDGVVRRVDVATGSMSWLSTHGHWINSMSPTQGGSAVVTSYHNRARFVDVASGATLGEVDLPQDCGRIHHMTSDGGHGVYLGGTDGSVLVLDSETRTLSSRERLHAGEILSMDFDRARRCLITAGIDGKIIEKPIAGGPVRTLADTQSPVPCVLVDGEFLITSERGGLTRRDRHTGAILQQQPTQRGFWSLRILDAERYVTSSTGGLVTFWDRRTLDLVYERRLPVTTASGIAVDPSGKWVAIACEGGNAWILHSAAPATDFATRLARARAASARVDASMGLWQHPWAPAAARRLRVADHLPPERRALAERMLPPPAIYHLAMNSVMLGLSPTAADLRRDDLASYRSMLEEALQEFPEHPHRVIACIGLGLVCVRLGAHEAALTAVAEVQDPGSLQASWCAVRALASAGMGRSEDAAIARDELRTLCTGARAGDLQAQALLREVDAALR